jgi:hypothetical protein
MTRFTKYLVAAAAAGGIATPALAQYPYPQPYPQYPPAYGYQQGYSNNPIQNVIDQLLGNRYNVNDRTAVRQCAQAAMQQAAAQYRPQGYNQYGQPYGNAYGYNQYGYTARVTAITNVERRNNGLRVSGLLDSGRYGYGNQGYNQNQRYATGDLTFRCNVDYRGVVTNVRIRANNNYRRPY